MMGESLGMNMGMGLVLHDEGGAAGHASMHEQFQSAPIIPQMHPLSSMIQDTHSTAEIFIAAPVQTMMEVHDGSAMPPTHAHMYPHPHPGAVSVLLPGMVRTRMDKTAGGRSRTVKRFTARYFIFDEHNKKVPVCHFAFLSIYGIGKKRVDNLMTYFFEHGCAPPIDGRGKHQNRSNRVPDELVDLAKQHISECIQMFRDSQRVAGTGSSSDFNVVKMYRSFIQKYQPIVLEAEKSSVDIGRLRHYSRKRIRTTNAAPASKAEAASMSGLNPIVSLLEQLPCTMCGRMPTEHLLAPAFYVPPRYNAPNARSSSKLKTPIFSPLLGLFCGNECAEQWQRHNRIFCSDNYNPMQFPFRSFKEIPQELDLKDLLKPLVSRDKYDRLFREFHHSLAGSSSSQAASSS